MGYSVCVEVSGQFVGIVALLPVCGVWALNSGRKTCWHTPLSVEPSHGSMASMYFAVIAFIVHFS